MSGVLDFDVVGWRGGGGLSNVGRGGGGGGGAPPPLADGGPDVPLTMGSVLLLSSA